jgi:sulfur carrier protein ThiS adenylyltransferase
MGQIEISLNERPVTVEEGMSLFDLRSRYKPAADLVIRNGFPATQDTFLQDGDTVVLIRRGEIPVRGELEALMAARHTPGVHAVLKRASVGIAGVGGLGSTAAVALARVGVGRLVLADFDVVEPSNLNRQQYFVDQIGQIKVHALRDTLKRVNPFVEVEAHAVVLDETNVPALFGGVDVLVEAFDTAEAKAMLAESFLKARPRTPLVAASGLAGYHSSNSIVTRSAGQTLVLVGDGNAAAVPGQGLMAPRVGVAAHHQANAVLRLLLGESPA